ncbi:hypothetical protein AXG93_1175s1000 [Marchantia polymorpha subsp. ruderalis]|uniref:Reverse transcriptase Ty1/copia-type domain-containing protein n=1 Tax=Marchantia polymorpha subsp. ruderalis TaxID=1480154 RepID=A0A176VP87_MARPO|nr:hypothetical protein AXG93_1175s1000 [Marchantia polymorpha subsp. ruderalis]
MLSESGLPGEFWAETVNTAIYLVNLSPFSAINFSTPFEDGDGMAFILEEGEIFSYKEAQASVNKLQWIVAMEREMESLIDNKTWKLVEPPSDQTLIDSKWMYKLKDNPLRNEARIFKARMVVRGFTQEKCVDYNKVFSFVAKFNMIDSKGVWTTLMAHFKLFAAHCTIDAVEKGNMSCVPYEQVVASLMYLMVCTRPDIAFAMDKVMDSIVKHINIRYHFIREAMSDKTIELVKIDSKLNPTDALTKVVPLENFTRHCATMQVVHGEHM